MITPLIIYGEAIYWLLLLFFCIVTSVYAERREGLTTPTLWAIATWTYVFGFTTYSPEPITFGKAIVAYFLFAAIFTTAKWINLVYRIGFFVKTIGPYTESEYELRHMAQQAFKPMNAEDMMTLPPDPYEFRTRIMCWFFYWPAFTVFRCFAHCARWVNRKSWSFFQQLSKRIYADRD